MEEQQPEGSSSMDESDQVEKNEDDVAEEVQGPTPDEFAESLKEQGNAKYKEKDYYGAIRLYKQAIEAVPGNAAYYNNCAAAQLMVNQYARVIESCAECLKIDPVNVKALIRKGKAEMTLGKAADAQMSFKSALSVDPTNSTAFSEKKQADLLLARISKACEAILAGDFSHGLALAHAGLRQAPESRELLTIKVEGLIKAGDFDQAYAVTTSLMRDDQNDAKLLYFRARCLYFQENFPNAIRHLQQALQLDPDYKVAQQSIKMIRKLERTKEEGNKLFKAGKYQDAIESYATCLEIDPENKSFMAKLFCNRAACLQKTRQFERALSDCDSALESNPEYGKAYMRKAACLREIGGKANIERATHCYSEAERILGQSQEIQQALRESKLELKKAKRKDYYTILDLSNRENSSEQEIKKAYRKAALKWHPDRHTQDSDEDKAKAEASFKDVGEAYEVLSDSSKKQKYDSGLTLEEIEQGPQMGGGHHHQDPDEIFRMFFGGGGGGGGGHPFGGGGGGGLSLWLIL